MSMTSSATPARNSPAEGQGDPQSCLSWSLRGLEAEDGQEQVVVVFDLADGGGDLAVSGLADQPGISLTPHPAALFIPARLATEKHNRRAETTLRITLDLPWAWAL